MVTRLFAVALAIASTMVAASSAQAATIVNASGIGIDNGLPKQTSKLTRGGPDDACSVLGFAPATQDPGSQFAYRLHTSRSMLADPVCVTATITTSCTAAPNQIHSASYSPAFVPADPTANFAGDPGTIAGGSATYSFTVPANAPFATAVHEYVSGGGCGAYTLKWESDGPWASSRPTAGQVAPTVDATLTGTPGVWVATPALTRQWRRCDAAGANCTDIPGATDAAYTVTTADLGGTLRFRITATDTDGVNRSDSDPVEPYIPLGAPATGSLGAGDRVQNGTFIRNSVESRCTSPTSPPTVLLPASSFIYDEFPVVSLINEPTCLVFRTAPSACISGVTAAIYTGSYSGLTATNYAANSGGDPNSRATVSWTLPAGGSAVGVATQGPSGGACDSYGAELGTTTPFATARPVLTGTAAEGTPLSTSDGTWTGSPAFAQSWLRCDASGAACAPIAGAAGASYTPGPTDVGQRLRARVTATQGTSASVDSPPSEVVTAAAVLPGGGGGPGGGGPGGTTPVDRLAPKATLKFKSADARRALRRSRLPVAVTCNEACTVTLELRITSKLAKKYKLGKKVVIATVKGNLTAGRSRTLNVKLSSAAKKRLKRARSLKVSIRASARDLAGNSGTASAKATIRRAR